MDGKDKKKIDLAFRMDRVMEAFLYSKRWKKYWEKRQKNLYWYYLTPIGLKLFEKLGKFKYKDFNLYAIAQSHLDACWLWTKLSTIRRAILTFERAVKNIEKYPFFTFSQTSPQYYDWVRRLRPELFEKIKNLVKLSKFEICGGMWVEPDCNIPNGESLVRQRFYGQLFFLEHFGKISTTASLEDTFGFTAALPQIFLKSGATSFWTTKITWNDYSEFPFANFYWKGIDGSSIFTHCFVFNVSVLYSLNKYRELARIPNDPMLEFNSTMTLDHIQSHLQTDYVRTCGIFYGFGDGGMGPLEEEIGIYANIGRLGLLKFTTVENYFKILKKECGDLVPIWNDELYLEFHRGCYTSHSDIKKLNRFCEINLRNCEIINSFLAIVVENFEYPRKEIEKWWKTVLFNQFHDILPGSSIQDVYYEQEAELRQVLEDCTKSIKNAMNILASTLFNIESATQNVEYLVFNTLSWDRDDFVQIRVENGLIDYYVKDIPSLGFKKINLLDIENNNGNNSKNVSIKEIDDCFEIENNALKLRINKKTGNVVSLFSKDFEKEYIKNNDGIGLRVYGNKPQKHPAWNIDRRYTRRPVVLGGVKGLRIIKNINKITLKLIYVFKKSKISQYISLRAETDYVEFRTEMDIHDKNLMFKVRVPFDLNTNELFAEIPYGVLKRKIVGETEMEKGKWEFPGQKWVAISDKKYGITFVNDSKYGFSSSKKGLDMTLLVTPHYPTTPFFSYIKLVDKKDRQKYKDQGRHVINYALKPNKGDWVQAEPWKFGYEFNYPLLVTKINSMENVTRKDNFKLEETDVRTINSLLRKNKGLINISEPNIIIQVVKPHEEIPLDKLAAKITRIEARKGLILRLYETAGLETECKIKFHEYGKIKNIEETDMLEINKTNTKKIEVKNNQEFKLKFYPYEIKTLKIEMVPLK